MPKIAAIKAAPLDVPLKSALTWGSGHILPQLEHALVRVDLSDGATGIAEATPRPSIYGETQASIVHLVEAHLAPMLLDHEVESFAQVANLTARLARIKNNNCAKGALDMALHQALARSRGEPLARYLGVTRTELQLSAIVSTGSSDAVMADVAAGFRSGLRVFKVKIGVDIASEIDTLARLIQRHPAARFYVDANETLDGTGAAAILGRLHKMGVLYCEEALPVRRLRQRASLRRSCNLPIIADDSAFTLSDLERELAFNTFDVLNIKTARTGFSESRRMLDLCAANDKRVMVGSQASSLLGCLQAATFAGCQAVDCPSECSFYLRTEADLRLAPVIADGCWKLDAVAAALNSLQDSLARLM